MRDVMSNKTRSSQIKVPALTFTWEGRTVRAPVKAKDGQPAGTKTILDNQCGCVRPGMRLASLPVCVLPLVFTAVCIGGRRDPGHHGSEWLWVR